jgi:oxygen-independent coproporphyrinogen-3 oxidase
MKLQFHGHDEKYAVEQSLLAFFPEERPVYEAPHEGENAAEISLSCGKIWATAATVLTYNGQSLRAVSRVKLAQAPDEYERERLRQRAIKLSFFKAARALTGETPAWGALTGIRPGKVAARLFSQGRQEPEVDRILRDTYFVSPQRRRLCIESARERLRAQSDLHPEEISLYVGIPFCPTRCAYCSFVSNSVEKSFHLIEPYLKALHAEIDSAAQMVRELGLRIKSFYMGGGTPTTLSAPQLEELLTHLNTAFAFDRDMEYTVEAGRPDTITPEKLAVLRRCGVNRVSVNPQTMEDAVLAAIGRKHTAADIRRAMEQVRRADFPHVNMDLIAGLPEDTPDGFRRSLDECLAMGADNITIHTLSLKKGSRILLEGKAIPSPAAVGEMLTYADPTLRAHSFAPYYLYRQKYMSGSFENVGWCISGGECLYNIYIMEELHTILSLGAGGSTKMVDPQCGRIERVFNLKYPQEYIDRREKIQANQDAFRLFYHEVKKI